MGSSTNGTQMLVKHERKSSIIHFVFLGVHLLHQEEITAALVIVLDVFGLLAYNNQAGEGRIQNSSWWGADTVLLRQGTLTGFDIENMDAQALKLMIANSTSPLMFVMYYVISVAVGYNLPCSISHSR